MRNPSIQNLCLCCQGVAFILSLGVFTPVSANDKPPLQSLILIAHNSTGQQQTVLRRSILAMYSLRLQTWPDGSALTVYVLDYDTPLHRNFCREILGILPFHLRRNWDRLIFSGKTQGPIVVPDAQEMKRQVSRTPGAIGYINKEQLDDSVVAINIL
ncbi:MAG: hypothetical protein HRU20_17575 [Pseudomonadales bacterium]|nr:hypothetical protein [Pseudomonadales bacterium]